MSKSLPSRQHYLPDYATTVYAQELANAYRDNVKNLQASIQEALNIGYALNEHDPLTAAATLGERIEMAMARFKDRDLREYRGWKS
jgi:hypothetical protein